MNSFHSDYACFRDEKIRYGPNGLLNENVNKTNKKIK